jgi:hypothetical protein
VSVPSGSYVLSEPLHISKSITLKGAPAAILDAQEANQILKIDNPRASMSMINFMFMNGKGDYGGAINSQAKSLDLKDCRFSDNLAKYGAAVYQKSGDLHIERSTFENNKATEWGAAIYDNSGYMRVRSSQFAHNTGSHVICFNGTEQKWVTVSIKDCDISSNPGPDYERSSDLCGAIACANSTTTIDHCTIKDNKAMVGNGNAGLLLVSSDVTLSNTIIQGNEALYATAIYISSDAKVTMDRCDIKENIATSALYQGEYRGGDAAGIASDSILGVTMNDVVLKDNHADDDAGAIMNTGVLNMDKGTTIIENTANSCSALNNTKSGRVILDKSVSISDNQDSGQIKQPLLSTGALIWK